MVRAICPITISVVDNSGLSGKIKKDKKENPFSVRFTKSFCGFEGRNTYYWILLCHENE